MKKGKIITAAVLAATMLMGAGYSYWTDALVVTNTITTGTMDVQFVDANASGYNTIFGNSERNPEYVVAKPSTISNKAHDVAFNLSNLYPGAQYLTMTQEQNKGTIPVKFDNAVVSISGPDELKNNTSVSFACGVYDSQNKLKFLTPVYDVNLANLDKALNKSLANVRLEPGEYVALQGKGQKQGDNLDSYMLFELNGNNIKDSENATLNFTITLNWKQFNVK